jgi:hypothetical protein
MDSRSFGDIIWGLGSMNVQWNDLSPSLQQSLLTALTKHCDKLSAFALPSALWALAKMNLKWSQLSVEVRRSFPLRLEELASEMSPNQSSKAGDFSIQFNINIHRYIYINVHGHNLVWALGSLGAPYETFPVGMLDTHVDNVGKIKRSKMGSAVPASQTLTGLAKTGVSWDKISSELKGNIWEQVRSYSYL